MKPELREGRHSSDVAVLGILELPRKSDLRQMQEELTWLACQAAPGTFEITGLHSSLLNKLGPESIYIAV